MPNKYVYPILLLKVAESVRLQAELHEKEKTILRQQRKRCQKVYKDLETLRSKMNEAQGIYYIIKYLKGVLDYNKIEISNKLKNTNR